MAGKQPASQASVSPRPAKRARNSPEPGSHDMAAGPEAAVAPPQPPMPEAAALSPAVAAPSTAAAHSQLLNEVATTCGLRIERSCAASLCGETTAVLTVPGVALGTAIDFAGAEITGAGPNKKARHCLALHVVMQLLLSCQLQFFYTSDITQGCLKWYRAL